MFFAHCTSEIEQKQEIIQEKGFIFHINKTVENAEGKNEKEIIQLWGDYLSSGSYFSSNSSYWSHEDMMIPDYFLLQLNMRKILEKNEKKIQNTILGIYPVENDHYELKSMFTSVTDSTEQINLHYIVSIFAKKIDGSFKLVNSSSYYKNIWERKSVGNINYYIHPVHNFNEGEAKRMNEFNLELANKFESEPLTFDYFVSNTGREIIKVWGYDFMPRMLQPVQTGGMADLYNMIIYAGNNSAYYPHEVVHLYTSKYKKTYHKWIDEGLATFLGGSTGYDLDWHLQKLKIFLEKEPDYDLSDISKLAIDIPNGEHMTDFRYVIGGFICKKIHEKEGMKGIFEALQYGKTDEAFFRLLKEKLNIHKNNFDTYIKEEIKKI